MVIKCTHMERATKLYLLAPSRDSSERSHRHDRNKAIYNHWLLLKAQYKEPEIN